MADEYAEYEALEGAVTLGAEEAAMSREDVQVSPTQRCTQAAQPYESPLTRSQTRSKGKAKGQTGRDKGKHNSQEAADAIAQLVAAGVPADSDLGC